MNHALAIDFSFRHEYGFSSVEAWQSPGWCVGRSRRVMILLASIIILSLADLAITLAYLRANWMMEANPIAAYIIKSTQSAWVLTGYKCFTVGVCVVLLYRFRNACSGEIAAWLATGVLVALSIMWHQYAIQIENLGDMLLAHAMVIDDCRLGLP